MFKLKFLYLPLVLLLPILLFSACTQNNEKVSKSNLIDSEEKSINSDKNANDNPRYLIMMGRSVMNSWFDHWGWDGENPMQLERYTLEYRELSSPPEMIESVRNIMNELPEDKKDIIFFKFCFEDFLGDDAASKNLERNKNIVKEVHKIVTQEHNAKLIVGNALPQVISNTDIYLVWNHQQFISWLDEFWRDNPDNLTVFDMYNPITNELGALKTDYAVGSDDSHLNGNAYDVLDDKFFSMLDNLY